MFFPAFVLPGPLIVASTLYEEVLKGRIPFHVGQTLVRVAASFVIAMGVGVPVGILMGLRRYWESFFTNPLVVAMSVPSVVWAFLGIVWFGLVPITPIFAAFMITFPYGAFNVWQGTKEVSKELVDMGRAFGLSKPRITRRIFLPSLSPYIFASARYTFAIVWQIVIIAEAFASPNGIGQQIFYWYGLFVVREVLAWSVLFLLLMFVIEYFVFRKVERYIFKWRQVAVI